MSNERIADLAYPSPENGASVNMPAPQGVYAKTVQGGFWYVVNAGAQKILQTVVFFVMARILAPADYGVMAVIFIVNGLFNQLTNVPFGTALIQRRGDVERYLDAYWTFDILRSALNAAIIALCGGWIAVAFKMEAYETLIRLSGILLLIPTFSNARTVTLFREMDFRTLAIRDILTQVAYGAAALGYAFLVGRNAAALVAGYVAMYLFGVFLSYVFVPGRPRFSFAFGKLRELLGQAKWVYGQNLVDYASQYADKILLGLLLTPSALGFYAKAKDLSTSPAAFVASMARKVGLSAFALIQDSRVKIHQGMVRSLDVLFLTAVPSAIVFLLEGGTIIRVLLGDAWLPIVVPFKIMAVGGIFFAAINIINTTVIAVGRPDAGFKANLLQTILSFPLSWIGIRLAGMQGLAYATLGVWAILTAYLFIRVRHTIQVSRFDVARYAVIGFVTTGALAFLEFGPGKLLHARGILALDAAWVVLLGISYFVVLWILRRFWKANPWETGLSVIGNLVPRRGK
jgi:lipopolysaccharide exporter